MATKENEVAKCILGVLIAIGLVLLVMGCIVLVMAGLAWREEGLTDSTQAMLGLAAQMLLAPLVAIPLVLLLGKGAVESKVCEPVSDEQAKGALLCMIYAGGGADKPGPDAREVIGKVSEHCCVTKVKAAELLHDLQKAGQVKSENEKLCINFQKAEETT